MPFLKSLKPPKMVDKKEGCAHVDGYLCDYPECTMNTDYVNQNHFLD